MTNHLPAGGPPPCLSHAASMRYVLIELLFTAVEFFFFENAIDNYVTMCG